MIALVRIGDTIRIIVEVLEKKPTGSRGKGVQTWRYTDKIQRGETVMTFEYKWMFHMHPSHPSPKGQE